VSNGDNGADSALKGIRLEQMGPEYWAKLRQEHADCFPGALLGGLPDRKQEALEELLTALDAKSEEAIQKVLTAHPYLIQYAVWNSGHHGTWVFPKQMIRMRAADGTPGLIPDFLIVTKSSLGYFWYIVELKRFDMQFANAAGDAFSPEGGRAVGQCPSYIQHFQNYIDLVRSNIRIPDVIQPRNAILLMGDSETETDAQQQFRSNFVRSNPSIEVVSYRRILAGLESDLGVRATRP
jgi:hypothetical protein